MTDDLLAQLQKRIDYDRRHYKPDPLLSEVAERIKALEAENERLRGALGLIIENESADTGYGNSSAKIARGALGDWKPEAGDLGGDHVR